MTKKELFKMIEDEVSVALQSTVTEPVPPQKDIKPVQRKANLSNEELDEVIFFGGEKPKEEDEDFNISKNK